MNNSGSLISQSCMQSLSNNLRIILSANNRKINICKRLFNLYDLFLAQSMIDLRFEISTNIDTPIQQELVDYLKTDEMFEKDFDTPQLYISFYLINKNIANLLQRNSASFKYYFKIYKQVGLIWALRTTDPVQYRRSLK